MNVKHCYINYATLKRRGYDNNYEYIYTVHKYPVRMPGYEDIDFLKSANSRIEFGNVDDEVRFASSIARSRSKVLQLGCNNRWDFFVTLTISPDSLVDRYNFKEVIKSLLKFFDNYKQRRSSEFKYLVIPEKHQDGAYHFHGFFANINSDDLKINDYGYLDFVPYCKKYGFCSMSVIKDCVACANYVSKYISKDMFNGTIPEARTHLYYASRSLKFDELVSVGTAVPMDIDSRSDCFKVESAYCCRYFCKTNIFEASLDAFGNLASAPELPSPQYVDYFRKRILYDFCNKNNIAVNEKTDLLRLYNSLRDEIINNSLWGYEILKQHYAELRHFFNIESLSDSEIEIIEKLFDCSYVLDCIDEPDSLSEDISIPFTQLSLWGENYVDE